MTDLVTVSSSAGIAAIGCNRRHKHNSLIVEMFDAIHAAADVRASVHQRDPQFATPGGGA